MKETGLDKTFRQSVVKDLRSYVANADFKALLTKHGSPLLVLDPGRIRKQYQALQKELPMVDHHFAIKALRHPAAITAIDSCGGFFDIMTNGDIDMVREQGISPERCTHTNPIKKPSDIAYALDFGLTTFVVDNVAEVEKFAPYTDRVTLLIRLSFSNPEAKSNLSFKFGIHPDEAETIISAALAIGLKIGGFTLHVGSQIHTAEAYVTAITKVKELMSATERRHDIQLSLLDIGGGFPVSYLTPAPLLADIAQAIIPLLEPLTDRIRILSEPGRFIVAPAATLITQVVGKSIRQNCQWYYIDDGLYGTYSSVIYEDVTQPIVALKEVMTELTLPLELSVIAGPTCDSVDIISTGCLLPELTIGDQLISPMMGSYTVESASDFNGIPRTPIVIHTPTQPGAPAS